MIKCFFIAGHLFVAGASSPGEPPGMVNLSQVTLVKDDYFQTTSGTTVRAPGVNLVEELPRCVEQAEEEVLLELE